MFRAQPRRASLAGWSSWAPVARPGILVEEESSTRSVEVLTKPGDFSMSRLQSLILSPEVQDQDLVSRSLANQKIQMLCGRSGRPQVCCRECTTLGDRREPELSCSGSMGKERRNVDEDRLS